MIARVVEESSGQEHESTGLLRDGRANGPWVLFRRVEDDGVGLEFEQVEEGPFVDGKRQ